MARDTRAEMNFKKQKESNMFKYVKYIPVTDAHTTHVFNELNEKCKVHRFDVPCVSIEYTDEKDFTELMASQNKDIVAVELQKAEFIALVKHSDQVKRMYDVANDDFKREMKLLLGKYTQEEINTWSTQVEEAMQIKNGLPGETPFLLSLSGEENITVSEAAEKILMSKKAYATHSADCLKRKRNTVKKLKAEVGI
jgi:hypothetical protein